jgi:long-chain fatty acid transport protein
MTIHRLARFAVAVYGFLAGVAAVAQTTSDINAGLQFNFTPPGAKSLAMGGAFSGVADDATAVYANPGGLTGLSRPEASLELRGSQYTNVYPSGTGTGSTRTSATGVGFGSVVYPIQDWTFAVYYHEPAHFSATINSQSNAASGLAARNGRLDLDINSVGGAAAYHFAESLSAGLTIAAYDYQEHSSTAIPAAPAVQTVAGSGNGIGGSLGLRWSESDWSAGVVYRLFPTFHATGILDQPGLGVDPVANCHDAVCGVGRFKVPDVYSTGIGYQATSRLLLSFEYDLVLYSQLVSDLVPLAASRTAGALSPATNGHLFSIPDGSEFHLGAEYRLRLNGENTLLLRAGTWREPDHTLRYDGPDSILAARFGTEASRTAYFHGSIGAGLVLLKSIQLDAGADFSSRLKTYALTAAYRLPPR